MMLRQGVTNDTLPKEVIGNKYFTKISKYNIIYIHIKVNRFEGYLHMTAEVSIMNSYAIALAADSAVTIGSNIFNTANKIYMLSKYRPIGLMIYNAVSFMEIPFETIIALYRKVLKKESFETLKEYAQHFIQFLQDLNIPHECEEAYILWNLMKYYEFLKRSYNEDFEIMSPDEAKTNLYNTMETYHTVFSKAKEIGNFDMKNDFGDVIKMIEIQIEKDGMKEVLTQDKFERLIETIYLQLTKEVPLGPFTGVVIAGFGEEEIFPGYISFSLYGKIKNVVKICDIKKCAINPYNQISIEVFGQHDVAQSFLNGIDKRYFGVIEEYFKDHVLNDLNTEGLGEKEIELLKQNLGEKLNIVLQNKKNEYERILIEINKERMKKNEARTTNINVEKEKEIIKKILNKEFSKDNKDYFLKF